MWIYIGLVERCVFLVGGFVVREFRGYVLYFVVGLEEDFGVGEEGLFFLKGGCKG